MAALAALEIRPSSLAHDAWAMRCKTLRAAFLRPFEVLKEVAALVAQHPGDAARLVEAARTGEQTVDRLRRGEPLGCLADVGDCVHRCEPNEAGQPWRLADLLWRATYLSRTPSMRACQPSPVDLKYSRTSRL